MHAAKLNSEPLVSITRRAPAQRPPHDTSASHDTSTSHASNTKEGLKQKLEFSLVGPGG